jgi:hypothetical protein
MQLSIVLYSTQNLKFVSSDPRQIQYGQRDSDGLEPRLDTYGKSERSGNEPAHTIHLIDIDQQGLPVIAPLLGTDAL